MTTLALQRRAADHLSASISVDAFKDGLDGTVDVLAAGPMQLPSVQCWAAGEHRRTDRADLLRQEDVPVQRPVGMPEQGAGLLRAVHHPPLRITRLRGAVCVPGGVVVSKGCVLAESFSATWEAYQHRHLHPDGDGWRLTGLPEFMPERLPLLHGPILYLDHQHIDWFGHVLLDLMAPAWAFEYCRAYLGVGGLRVLCSRPQHGFVLHLLEAAGMGASTVVLIDGPVRCEELLVATKAFQIQEYTSPPAIRLWRATSTRVAGGNPLSSGRIYVSRSCNPTRQLVEEAEVEKVFRRHGFQVFHPEQFDITAQIRVFAGAEMIAGCSGSNMFGLAFQNRAQAILVLVSPLLIHYSEQLLHASHEGCSLTMVIGSVRPDELAATPGNVHCIWHMNVQALEFLVADWVREHGDARS